jgi:protein-L-isoaspartate(D-aspartate) O-methyltransferase
MIIPETKFRSFTKPFILLTIIGITAGCDRPAPSEPEPDTIQTISPSATGSTWPKPRTAEYADRRKQMVNHIVNAYDLDDPDILRALTDVPRHWFVPDYQIPRAYTDSPLSIGHNQTISQPYIVALMTSLLDLDDTKKVLEIGTGSGYQAAVLNEFTPHVYTIEIIEPLAAATIKKMNSLGYETINFRIGDGYNGWPEARPFDAIIVTAAPDHVPPNLLEQLAPGGKMVIPVGRVFSIQDLLLITKDTNGNITRRSTIPVRFVPLLRE